MAEKEYVEREKAIDACFNGWNNDAHDCAENISLIPAADVVEVVRCKDCKHGQGAKMDFWNEYEGIECIGGVVHRKNWFCADGERKDGDGDV